MIKRIETRQDKVKKDRKKQWLLAGILILVMLGSVFGVIVNSFGTNSQQPEMTYNGFIFINENGVYSTQVGNSRFYFSYNPKDIDSLAKEVSMEKTLQDYSGKSLYVSSVDFSSYGEIRGNLQNYAAGVQEACLQGEECTNESLPKKTCLDNMIVIKYSEKNRIYESSNCIYIEGKEKDLLKLTDEFLLQLIGVK